MSIVSDLPPAREPGSGILTRKSILFLLLFWLLAACGEESPTPAGSPVPTASPTPEIGVTLITRAPPTVAVIRTTPTPLPTPTPTPTATPIIYRVAEGDTLLGIALENFTTVEEIGTRNPGVVPQLLQIGQELVLPPPATPIFQGEANTPVPLTVTVARVATYRTPVGSLWILGEVENEGDYPVANVRVEIGVGDGPSRQQVPAWVVPGVIPAGAVAPFGVLVPEAPPVERPPTVSVVGGESLTTSGTYALDLAAGDVEATIEEDFATLSGTIENEGESSLAQVVVVATFYDAQGRVSGYAQQRLAGPLRPGGTLPFAVEVAPPGGGIVDYGILVLGLTE